jgi:FkbM family methyltransferase
MTFEPITLLSGDRMYVDELDSSGLKANGICEKKETEFVKSFIKPHMVCVDIGANVGYYTIMMAKLAKKVIAFEPDLDNYSLLWKNTKELNLINNVKLYPYAVGPEFGIIGLHKCETDNGMHRIYNSKWCQTGSVPVNMIALDGMVDEVDFIKMDIEGAEYGALLGMTRILKERPTIMMEFNVPSIIEYGRDPKEVYDFMTNLGYIISFPDERPVTYEELYEIGKNPSINIICTPQ